MSDLRDAYRDTHPCCQIAEHLDITFKLVRGKWELEPLGKGTRIDGHETNHIWSLNRRPDLPSNLIRLAWTTHRWFHGNLKAGRVLCVLAKLKAGELVLPELNAAAGKNVIGSIEAYKFGEAWVEKLRVECLDRLLAIEKEAA